MTSETAAELIYLDFNATTPILPEVLEAMLPYLRDGFGNPSSDHPKGTRARDAIELARRQVASLIGASPPEIIFTSCATESSNSSDQRIRVAPSGALGVWRRWCIGRTSIYLRQHCLT